jgi:lysophospholipase L1-like esterase
MLASLLGAAVLALAAYDGVVIGRALYVGGQLARESSPYSQQPADATAALLVVGDSTGVGTGAEDPADSVAGRLGSALPGTRIDNLAVNGALTEDVLEQLRDAPLPRYDAILVQVGGNDALRFTPLDRLEADIAAVLSRAGERAPYTALMSTGDLGAAPALPWPVAPVYSARSRAVRDRFLAAAREHGADYVDLFTGAGDNGFRQAPDRYYARDGLHLSGAGYGSWYDRLTAATALPERLQTR